MLRFHTSACPAATKSYFAAADYYAEGQETVGRWGGRLAARLGLSGTVGKDEFDKLCDNRRPDGSRLTPRDREGRRVGEDMVFSLPKEAGAAIMLCPDAALRERLLAGVEARVWQVAAMIEADVETRVRKGGAFENRPGDGLAFAAFFHTTSRPVAGAAPDPHPHWHLFAFNATRDPDEGRIKAADLANVYRDSKYYEAAFYALVAKDLAAAGLAVERRADGRWGLKGLESVGALFSKRTNEIEEEAQRLNIADESRKARLGATTRGRKRKELTPDELRADWRGQMSDEQKDALDATFAGGGPGDAPVTAREAVAYALDHCSEKLSVIPERELLRVAMLRGLGSVTPADVEAELANPVHGLIRQVRDGRASVTTAALQVEEDEIVRGSHPFRNVPPLGVAEGLTRELPGGKRLNDGQWEAVTGLLNSPLRVTLIEGPAGAGKSSLLAKFDEGVRLRGQRVTYLATTAKATGVLQADGFAAHTLARFLMDEKLQKAAHGGRVVVDETSLLGHQDAVRLMRLAARLDLKLICVGDPWQHGSVGRGGFHRLLKTHASVAPFKLTEILRQSDSEYREAAKLLSEGKTLEGLGVIEAKGWVKEIESPEDRYQAMADEYVAARGKGESVLMVSPTHREAARITEAARAALKAAGQLGEDERTFERLVSADATEAERGLATTYRAGDVIQFHQNAKGNIGKGTRIKVTSAADAPLAEAGKFQIYRAQKIALARGDLIRFTGTVHSLGGGKTYRNGETAVVAGFDRRGNIKLEGGVVIAKDAGHFRHGYVETSFGSQGSTVQRVILGLGAESLPAANQEQLYVSLTRARSKASLYTDDLAGVKRAVLRSSQKLVALDLPGREAEAGEEGPAAKPAASVAAAAPASAEANRRDAARTREEWAKKSRDYFYWRGLREACEPATSLRAAGRSGPPAGRHATTPGPSHVERMRSRERERDHGYER